MDEMTHLFDLLERAKKCVNELGEDSYIVDGLILAQEIVNSMQNDNNVDVEKIVKEMFDGDF